MAIVRTRGPRRRVRATDRAKVLLAAAAEMETSYGLEQGSLVERAFFEAALAGELREVYNVEWPCEGTIGDHGDALARADNGGTFRLDDGTLVMVFIGGGWLHARFAVERREQADALTQSFAAQYPPLYREQPELGNFVPITFWTLGRFGPTSRLRMIESASWDDIGGNYSSEACGGLEKLMDGYEPGKDGQLILWQGPPGTGKTWALRALASQWRSWCEFHYITDPDAFFVADPSYMVDVLLSDTYDELLTLDEDGPMEVVSTVREGGKWRVLVLEDTGELLSANAKEQYGQGLSRVLNVVDGLVGQGLRVMLLVTTNDELGDLHPAVTRPGRCASQIVFGPLPVEEANKWLLDQGLDTRVPPVEAPATLAELYARAGAGEDALQDELVEDLAAALSRPVTLSKDEVVAEIRTVAERHQPDEPAYGGTYWNAETHTVYWISWDGTSVEEHDAAVADFLAIPGVDHVEVEAESAVPVGDDWTRAYTVDADALSAVLSEARAPLTTESGEPLIASEQPARVAGDPETLGVDLTSTLRDLAASGELADSAALTAALEAVGAAHASSMDTIRTLLYARASGRETTVAPDVLTMAALGVLEKFASRPAPPPSPAPVTHVHIPKHDLSVHVDGPTIAAPPPADVKVEVNLPEQPAPQVTVEAARAPEVTVQAPPAPEIRVEVPAQPAPVVYVTAAAPEPRSKVVTVDYDPAGNRQYHIDELERGDE